MTEVHLYVADDGTEFEDESECLSYEAGQRARGLKGRVVLLTETFRPIPLDNLEAWDDVWFVFVKDTEALHDLSDAWDWDFAGMSPPPFLFGNTAGLFYYDGDTDEWYHMGTRIQAFQALADEVMGYVNSNL